MNKETAITLVQSLIQQGKSDNSKDMALQHSLSDIQQLVFGECWDNVSYKEIAQKSGYEYNYVKRVGSQVWRLLSETLGQKVSKSNFHSLLEQYVVKQENNEIFKSNKHHQLTFKKDFSNSNNTENKIEILQQIQDLEKVIDTTNFFGRKREISQLEYWLDLDRCRLIAILGIGGIGKTTIAAKLARQVEAKFEYVIWFSLRNAPACIEFLDKLILSVSPPQEINSGETVDSKINCLLNYLRDSRCLLIVDNAESILRSQDRAGYYCEGYEDYEQLFRRIADETHQSCMIITSRELPTGIANRVAANSVVRSLQLTGLSSDAAKEILKLKSVPQSQSLIKKYTGNPLALKIAATTIQSIFAGNISEFLVQETFVYGDIWDLLAQQFDRLSPSEQTVMYWLAINREWTTIKELREDIFPHVSCRQLIEALESLNWRSLIEVSIAGYTQQPMVMEYVTELIVDRAAQEIIAEEFDWLKSFCLMKAQTKDYLRDAQIQFILHPTIEKLTQTLGDRQKIIVRVNELIERLHSQTIQEVGYARCNCLNLLEGLKFNFSGRDLSHLTLWQAYLTQV